MLGGGAIASMRASSASARKEEARVRRRLERELLREREPRRDGSPPLGVLAAGESKRPAGSRAAELASIRYAERRALESAARWFDAQLELPASSVEYYQERRLRSLNLDPIETAEDLDALRAAGRAYSDNDW